MAIIKLFLGEQDGLVLQNDGPSSLIWVPSYTTQNILAEAEREGERITKEDLDELEMLPYTLVSSAENETGEKVCRYEFCEELLVAHEEP